ncbi:MAG: Anucleate primary sterigmata protein B [Candelina submexicana]|nr:MAG: Anucleate primary sterigmata protein B [Candelina submexicana]
MPSSEKSRNEPVPGDDQKASAVGSKSEDGNRKFGDDSHQHSDDTSMPSLPQGDSSQLQAESEDGESHLEGNNSGMNEQEMRRKLMDVESSFVPDQSTLAPSGDRGADDTYVYGASSAEGESSLPPTTGTQEERTGSETPKFDSIMEHSNHHSSSPPTPPEAYQTPAPPHGDSPSSHSRSTSHDNKPENEDGEYTSSLETMSSSPTAAAAARTVSRVLSVSSFGGYDTADDGTQGVALHRAGPESDNDDSQVTPRKLSQEPILPLSQQKGTDTDRPSPIDGADESTYLHAESNGNHASTLSRRPRYLQNRHASQRSSTSSNTNKSDYSEDAASDITVGADFALQTGGAAPVNCSRSRPIMDLSRTTSLGSIASGITPLSEGEGWLDHARTSIGTSHLAVNTVERSLTPPDEEGLNSPQQPSRVGATGHKHMTHEDEDSPPSTPRASKGRTVAAPTDTVIAQHVRDVQVPASVAREFRKNNPSANTEKSMGGATPLASRGSRNLTLKEQSNTINRLSTENFDLKLKIHFLRELLSKRSDEGVEEINVKNAELQAGLIMLQRETKRLKRTVRDLERELEKKEEGLKAAATDTEKSDDEGFSQAQAEELMQEMTEEIMYLRERVETYETEVDKLRNESITKEGEKRHLAGVVKSMGDRKGGHGDIGAREEMEMWKDLLDAETARREQADDDNRKLREELARLKSDGSSVTTNNHMTNAYNVSRHQRMTISRSQSHRSDSTERHGVSSAASSTIVEQLRHENAELRREVGAQTSMLTSRNREKERLYQEIEDLKLGQRRGDGGRSVAGDSIFERSASRAHQRSVSRASVITGATLMSDAERDELENRNGALRDTISDLKLKNQELVRKLDATQELERELERCIDELEKGDNVKAELESALAGYRAELDSALQDLQTMQAERDELLEQREEADAQYEALRQDAQHQINLADDRVEERIVEAQRLNAEIKDRKENFNSLQNEMRSLSEVVVKLEDEQQTKARKLQNLQHELEDANKEIESLEKSLEESHEKNEKLSVQQESCQGEIAFLREEQDGDKIKISDLESALETAHNRLQEEKDKLKQHEEQLAEERHQREIIGSKEKQEVQKMINDLNREMGGAKDEARQLRKSVTSREMEAKEWKERLMELESSLREALGDLNGTRSSLLKSITKLQKELDSAVSELDTTKNDLAEKDRLLKTRDALLESAGLESQKLSDLLEKERQARRADKHNFEQIQKTHQSTTRTMSHHQTRINELETARQHDRKKHANLEQQFRDQLAERNNLLLALWNRLSTMCGTDWAHQNSLVSGKLPSLEVVASMLPAFSKNLLLAVKTVEGLIGGFKSRIRGVERDLWKEYQTLEHNLDLRVKKLDKLESIIQAQRTASQNSAPEIARLRGENRLLKAELSILQKPDARSRTSQGEHRLSISGTPNRDVSRAAVAATLMRHHSSSAVETLERAAASAIPLPSAPIEPSQQRWVHRLKELERRLKAEREARLLDRSGARKRLEQGRAENEELRMELERERIRKGNLDSAFEQ